MIKWPRFIQIGILGFVSLWTINGFASFAQTTKRYVSPRDIGHLLAQKFPVLNNPVLIFGNASAPGPVAETCWALSPDNMSVVGTVNPALNIPSSTTPGPTFVRWWVSCLGQIAQAQMNDLKAHVNDQKLWQQFWLASWLAKYRDKNKPNDPYHLLNTIKWSSLKDPQQDEQVRFLIEMMIGPNPVISDLGLSQGSEDLASIIKQAIAGTNPAVSLMDANAQILVAIAMREEFITY